MRAGTYFVGTVLLAIAVPAFAQRADISVVGGGGFTLGEDQDEGGVVAVGATAGLPYSARHRFQFDYMFHEVLRRTEERHFLTGSYVIQSTTGRTRAFFQVGGGLGLRRLRIQAEGPGGPIFVRNDRDNALAIVLGGGATVELGRSVFIRPQVRLYGHVGPTLTLLPSIAVGWRF